ncbi:MAG TPA: L,D-transpeptidase family protein [Acidimicrobiales bacterium]|nr:L,D-transpeptidase family protein [Acidimicrobiales bacterium]
MHPSARTFTGVTAAVLVAAGLSACTGSSAEDAATTTSTTTTSTTTTTTAPPTTTTTAKPIPPGLGRGAKGPEVQALEERLAALKYDTGIVNDAFDAMTQHAVTAFQKVHGLPRTGRATDDVVKALQTATPPPPMMPDGGGTRVEVDLKRQVLFLYKGGELTRILPVSTGNNKRYCVDGQCATAVTPGGSFKVNRKIKGLRVSRLGKLYNPLYFNGGIAIHGAPSVPAYPASHGCVRIPMPSSPWFHDTVDRGTPVYVLGGKRAPVPFDEQAPGEGPTTTTSTSTTTTAPTTTTTVATSTTTAPTTSSTTTSSTPPSTP